MNNENVTGTVIGPITKYAAHLYNIKGEPQGQLLTAETEKELKVKALNYFDKNGGLKTWADGLDLRIYD